jgi:hypothetical protein
VHLRRDESAASPLVVLTTFVLVAVLLTITVYALAFDRPEPGIAFTEAQDGGALAFDVTSATGGLEWSEVDVQFIDRAGTDVSTTFLHLPTGSIDRDDRIAVAPQPPAGLYILRVLHDGDELSRIAVSV